ncbi:MAG: class I SAM-dependent methyltransferase [Deltaproteobacteria bacterium]|nr:class I SAM-dependent methyltransferase [Deltaproteobacteria bacterium]
MPEQAHKKRRPQVKEGYYLGNYETLPMWINHWHQIQSVLDLKRESVLEIGPGNGVVSYFLRKCRMKLHTCDIDPHTGADTLADIVYLPYRENSFDIILCCEVLEHIPYEEFERGLCEIHRISKEYAVISVPAPFAGAAFALNLPKLTTLKFHAGVRFMTPKKFDGQHYWELGRLGYPLRRIRNSIRNSGFSIVKTFRPALSLFCYFFILKKEA